MDLARAVADAVLYEGYLLYPYRASAVKNRVRWQFGVLVPPAYTETGEPSASVTECLLDGCAHALLRLRLRFLHVKERRVERARDGGFTPVAELTCDGTTHLTFDEATARQVEAVVPMPGLLGAERVIPVRLPGDRAEEPIVAASGQVAGRVVTVHRPVRAVLRLAAERQDGPYGLLKLRVRVENAAEAPPAATREEALRHSLVAAHLVLGVTAGSFLSLVDPPEWARRAAEGCRNAGTFPVLVGGPGHRDAVLSSPIILYDHPGIAPESPGELFDGTEIDELLHLRTHTLTEAEKREARATDPRAAEIIDRAGELPPELLDRLHGAIRHLGPVARTPAVPSPSGAPGPGRQAGPAGGPVRRGTSSRSVDGSPAGSSRPVDGSAAAPSRPAAGPMADPSPGSPGDPMGDLLAGPWTEGIDGGRVTVAGVEIGRGSRVRLAPGARRADAHDMFLTGRTAQVEAVLRDVDGGSYLAVVLEDDPGADLHRSHGRFLYFAPDEVEPVAAGGGEAER
ncbi:hypothetical protein Sme01_51700 [Sphaerisporangium melleum]|uniref:Uncharacterized protein n=1 Tax=Sphaerisporangium melleum TaxID=321316 RepID=A0A917QXP8_9ACTN|nr:hypothetical protein [Sphaerisporangium melleum]GGK75957.1 hypothetical protein GCM10007964_18460 [Sphaerisporangium melleum]GII72694.1 hypothetical protein Sme01_51700 [Sphaerisporangium melleum]